MNPIAYLRSFANKLFSRNQANEIDEELRSHIAHRADDLVRSGIPRARAERQARVEFGGVEHYKEESFQASGGNFFNGVFSDVAYAVRVLRKSPGFVVSAVSALALAIGANAVVFGVLDALVFQTLNVPGAKSLYGTQYGTDIEFQSYPSFVDLRQRNHSFEDMAAFNMMIGTAVDTGNDPRAASGYATTGNYFAVLKEQPYLGRFYTEADEHGEGSAPYIVLTYNYWHTRFNDDRSVVGRTVLVNKHPFTVLGVAAPEFGGTLMFVAPDFFVPIVEQ
ncbi:MAG TPA: ABC transporter permease, partial [Terracidiphilus sp.]|nr:ABC transporter permease [Terracidiphilus sp.]